MTEQQAKAIADLLCAVIDYLKAAQFADKQAIINALMNIKELP